MTSSDLPLVYIVKVEGYGPVITVLNVAIAGLLGSVGIGTLHPVIELRAGTYRTSISHLASHWRQKVGVWIILKFSEPTTQRRLFLMLPSEKSSCFVVAIGHSSQLAAVKSPGVLFTGSRSFWLKGSLLQTLPSSVRHPDWRRFLSFVLPASNLFRKYQHVFENPRMLRKDLTPSSRCSCQCN